MSTEGQPVSAWGWTLSIGAASADGSAESSEFHAVYRGESFGAPRRGLLAAVSSGVGAGRAAMEAAQIAVQSFSEGYFGAPPTLGARHAAGRAADGFRNHASRRGFELFLRRPARFRPTIFTAIPVTTTATTGTTVR